MKYMHKNYLRQLYSYAIKLSLADAVFGGFENLLKYLLKNFSFTSQDLSFELTKAAKNGHENVVSLLLSKIDRLQEESLIRALEFCIEKNHQNIIRILLSEGRTVTDDNKDHLIQTANNFRNSFALELLNSILR